MRRRQHGDGRLYLPTYTDRKGKLKHASIWWWEVPTGHGKNLRGATGVRGGTPDKPPKEAELILAQKRVEFASGKLSGWNLMWEHLAATLVNDRAAKGLKSLPLYKDRLKHISGFFAGTRAFDIVDEKDPSRTVAAYVVQRRTGGEGRKPASIATINLELNIIRQAFNLAVRKGKLSRGPCVELIPGANIRQGFVEDEELKAILSLMPAVCAAAASVMRLTGWRRSEVLGLQWANVDWANLLLRLEPGTTKNKRGRVFPFGDYEALRGLLESQRASVEVQGRSLDKIIPWVFPGLSGSVLSVPAFYHSWKKAAKRIGSRKTPHDLRRTFARGALMSGVDRGSVMALGGWESAGVFERYAIKDLVPLRAATSKLNGPAVQGGTAQLALFRRG